MTQRTDDATRDRRGASVANVERVIASRLRERRAAAGLSMREVAAALGITPQQQSKYEAGRNRITAGKLYMLAEVLNVSVTYFFEGVDSPRSLRPNPESGLLLDFMQVAQGLEPPEQELLLDVARRLARRPTAGVAQFEPASLAEVVLGTPAR